MGLCVSSQPISYVMIERIYILCLISIIKWEVWTIIHCLGLGHETMLYAVCFFIFDHLIIRGHCYGTQRHRTDHDLGGVYCLNTYSFDPVCDKHIISKLSWKYLTTGYNDDAFSALQALVKIWAIPPLDTVM